MQALTENYRDNIALLDRILRVEDNFDILKKILRVADGEMTLYYIDGFIKDTVMIYICIFRTTKSGAISSSLN